ncbi:MAG: hypothetical protein ACTSYD_08170 [Candidatus Heimdallarchaeaceae archaeon]
MVDLRRIARWLEGRGFFITGSDVDFVSFVPRKRKVLELHDKYANYFDSILLTQPNNRVKLRLHNILIRPDSFGEANICHNLNPNRLDVHVYWDDGVAIYGIEGSAEQDEEKLKAILETFYGI